mgnify:CR=1 FL=1
MSDKFWFDTSKAEDFSAFLTLNDRSVVLIKSDRISNNNVWRLYSPSGCELAVTDSRDMAFILARQHNLVAYSVH